MLDEWTTIDHSVGLIASGFFWCTNSLLPYRNQSLSRGYIEVDRLLEKGNVIGGNSVFSIRRDAFLSVGGYSKAGPLDDFELLLKLGRSWRLFVVPEISVLYQSPTFATSETVTSRYMRQAFRIRSVLRAHSIHCAGPSRAQVLQNIWISSAYFLARTGSRKRSWACLKLYLNSGGRISKKLVLTLLVLSVGEKLHVTALRVLDLSRAYFRIFTRSHSSNLRSYTRAITQAAADIEPARVLDAPCVSS